MRLAQVVEASHSDLIGHADSALLQNFERAECHAVVCRYQRFELGFTLIEQDLNPLAPAVGGVIAVHHQAFVEADAARFEFFLVRLETLFRVDLPADAAQESDTFVPVFLDQVAHQRTHPFRIIGDEHGGVVQTDRLRDKRQFPEHLSENFQVFRAYAERGIRGHDQAIQLFGMGKIVKSE